VGWGRPGPGLDGANDRRFGHDRNGALFLRQGDPLPPLAEPLRAAEPASRSGAPMFVCKRECHDHCRCGAAVRSWSNIRRRRPASFAKAEELIDTPAPLVAHRLDGLRVSAGRVGLRRTLFRDLNIVTRRYGRSPSLDRPYRGRCEEATGSLGPPPAVDLAHKLPI